MTQKEKSTRKQNAIIMVGFFAILVVVAVSIFQSDMWLSSRNAKKGPQNLDIKYYPITGPELSQRISNNDITVIDIRSIAEFGIEHIPDSTNIPLEGLAKSESIPIDRDIAVIGTAKEAEMVNAISTLNKKTDRKIYLLQGGFVDWKAIGEATVSWGDISSFTEQSKTSFISIDDFATKLKSGKNVLLIDARKNIYFKEGHIADAINIPLAEVEKRRNEIDISREIIIYSDSELEAFQEAVKLFDLRLVTSKVLKGGLNEWKQRGYVVVK